ncbi:MAG TPA: hypothetical protein VEX63_14500, partial [Flavisolibacter sp.]|nr:hypothetical protein [Flavisolibacter sp.]
MKQLLLLLLGIFCLQIIWAQAPHQINYQGVARNATGSPIAQKEINLRLSIREGMTQGNIVYRETRLVKTNNFGLFVVAIGGPNASSVEGSLALIEWSSGVKFLQVEIDI